MIIIAAIAFITITKTKKHPRIYQRNLQYNYFMKILFYDILWYQCNSILTIDATITEIFIGWI